MARGACKSIGGTTSLDGQAMIVTLTRKTTAQPKLMEFHVRCRLNGAALVCSAVGVARSPRPKSGKDGGMQSFGSRPRAPDEPGIRKIRLTACAGGFNVVLTTAYRWILLSREAEGLAR